MKCAIITVKHPDGEFDVLDVRENITESKELFNKIRQEQRIKEREHLRDPEKNEAPDYLAVFNNYQPQGRYVSKAGYISEAEAKEAEKAKRAKAKAVQQAKANAQAEKEAAEKKAEEEANKKKKAEIEAKRKIQLEREQMEAKAVAKAEKAEKTLGKNKKPKAKDEVKELSAAEKKAAMLPEFEKLGVEPPAKNKGVQAWEDALSEAKANAGN